MGRDEWRGVRIRCQCFQNLLAQADVHVFAYKDDGVLDGGIEPTDQGARFRRGFKRSYQLRPVIRHPRQSIIEHYVMLVATCNSFAFIVET